MTFSLAFRKLILYLLVLGASGGGGWWVRRWTSQPPEPVATPVALVPTETVPVRVSTAPPRPPSQHLSFIAEAVEQVAPSVVRIDAVMGAATAGAQGDRPWLDRFLGDALPESPLPDRRGTGSGFVLNANGQIITNAHVVDGASSVLVSLKDGRQFPGQVLGVDSLTDIAVVQIQAQRLPTPALGHSSALLPGQWAIAIGNPLGLDHTVTVGIVSATGRSGDHVGLHNKRVRFIQTDAAINPGNSGGPLIDDRGQVVGVNTAMRTDARGLGFAIPIETAQRVAQQLVSQGRVDHPYLGIRMLDLNPETRRKLNQDTTLEVPLMRDRGVAIVQIVPGSPADRAGLRRGDVLLQVGETPVDSVARVQDRVDASQIGEPLSIQVLRGDRPLSLDVRPQAIRPAS